MRITLSTVLAAAVLALVKADFYSPRYDNFDVQPLLENDRILKSYIKCFLDQGPCSPDAKDFRKIMPEALETTCAKCSPKQKILIRKVVNRVMEKHPDAWEKLVDKYDKDKLHRDDFHRFLKEKD